MVAAGEVSLRLRRDAGLGGASWEAMMRPSCCNDSRRQRTRAFTELQSHYLFEDRFGRPGKGNDKGKVEGLVADRGM